MEITQFYLPGDYDSPLTATGRARTIAAFHLAQGDVDVLTNSDMRRDVLTALMSASAVTYWLHDARGWRYRVLATSATPTPQSRRAERARLWGVELLSSLK
jgi:hypothetical protein